jgi:hypothetical protein
MRVRLAVLARPALLLGAYVLSLGGACGSRLLDPDLAVDCDPNAGFSLSAPSQSITIEGSNTVTLQITVERNGENGEINFDLQRGNRDYGDPGLFELGVYALFLPNPVPENGTAVNLEATRMGTDEQPDLTDHVVFVRGFAGSGETAKECFMGVTITTSQ